MKSEKHTQEVLPIIKEDFATMMVELGNQINAKFNALKVELTKQEEEVVELTKAKPWSIASKPSITKIQRNKIKLKNKKNKIWQLVIQ